MSPLKPGLYIDTNPKMIDELFWLRKKVAFNKTELKVFNPNLTENYEVEMLDGKGGLQLYKKILITNIDRKTFVRIGDV